MSDRTIIFDKLEGFMIENHITNKVRVTVSFNTRQHGVFQIMCDEDGINEIKSEPNLYAFTKSEQQYIKEVATIVYRMVHDVPAKTDRFER